MSMAGSKLTSNIQVDQDQLQNLLLPATLPAPANSEARVAGLPIAKVIARLDSLLFVLKSCKGQTCRKPWQALHPEGNVETLKGALAAEFDHFYEVEQRRVQYNFCSNGYLVDAEGPMWETDGLVYRGGLTWDQWV
jgi:hypothetical protein